MDLGKEISNRVRVRIMVSIHAQCINNVKYYGINRVFFNVGQIEIQWN